MCSKAQNSLIDTLEGTFPCLKIKSSQSEAIYQSTSGLDPLKYYNIQEIYREDLAPTSISLANRWPDGEKVIIKKIFKEGLFNDFLKSQASLECQLHCSLDHPNIVKAYEWFEDDKEYSLVLEFVDKATYFKDKIDTNLNPIKSEGKMKSYINDILEGLAYLHSKGIIHGDVKLENMLLQTSGDKKSSIPIVKICDLGLARIVDKETKKSYMEFPVGSFNYMAPEVKAKSHVDEKIDIWALGVMIYKMAVAYKPTQISGYKYGGGPIPFRDIDWRKRSPELKDLIIRMLEIDPLKRISAAEALKHPWFRSE